MDKSKFLLFVGYNWVKILPFITAAAAIIFGVWFGYMSYTNKDFKVPIKQSNNSQKSAISGDTQSAPNPTMEAVPTTIPYKLPTGSQTYRFSNGESVVGPKIQTLIINPLDPAKSGSQTITLTIKHDSPVTSAVVTIITDNNESPLILKLTNGTDTDGTWTGNWTVNDTYNKRYGIKFSLKSSTGNYNNVMFIR